MSFQRIVEDTVFFLFHFKLFRLTETGVIYFVEIAFDIPLKLHCICYRMKDLPAFVSILETPSVLSDK